MVLEVSVDVLTRKGLEGDSAILETCIYLGAIYFVNVYLRFVVCYTSIKIHIKISCENI